jgi:hypothetical protein
VSLLVEWPILGQHLWALVLVWGWVILTGLALLPWLRGRVGLVAAPLLGVVFWSLALYLLPFSGGLDVAAALIVALVVYNFAQGHRLRLAGLWRRRSWSMLVIAIGMMPFLTTVLSHYVTYGSDSTMYMTAAGLIARARGLPSTYAPLLPDVALPPVNLGISALAGVAIRFGGESAAVMLATHHLTFSCLILATYLLLRWWVPRNHAAVLAVASVWLARSSECTISWGGFPTVLSVAIGIFAARMIIQQSRGTCWRLILLTGSTIAAIPLIHGVGGGTWIYCAGIWSVLASVAGARSPRSTLVGLALSAMCAGTLLLVYKCVGHLEVNQSEMETTRMFVQMCAPKEEGVAAWWAALPYIRKDGGSLITLGGLVACGVLALRRQWRALALLAGPMLALPTAVADARWYVLPGSFLMYPDRVLYWTAPLAAVAMALAMHALPAGWLGPWSGRVAAVLALSVSAYFHNSFYQKSVREDFVEREGFDALLWAKKNLDPGRDFVMSSCQSLGNYLPAVAQIGSNAAHLHHLAGDEALQKCLQRPCTHVFIDNELLRQTDPPTGKIIYRNRLITILELRKDTSPAKPQERSP